MIIVYDSKYGYGKKFAEGLEYKIVAVSKPVEEDLESVKEQIKQLE